MHLLTYFILLVVARLSFGLEFSGLSTRVLGETLFGTQCKQ